MANKEVQKQTQPLPRKFDVEDLNFETTTVSSLMTKPQASKVANAIIMVKAAMIKFVANGHDIGGQEFKKLTNKLMALYLVGGIDPKNEIKSLKHLASVNDWDSPKSSSNKEPEFEDGDDAPPGMEDWV